MPYDFDRIIPRRDTYSEKWDVFAEDVLPLWVADMDFLSPEPVIRALHERVEHGIYGYGVEPKELRELLVARLAALYGWSVPAEAIVFVPGLVVGLNVATRAAAQPGDGVLVQTPVYRPIIDAPGSAGQVLQPMALTRQADGRYTLDPELMAATITDRTRTFTLCNPHNPVGRVFTREELTAMAELCLRHDLTIISDEIHCDLLFSGAQHIPIASLSPELAAAHDHAHRAEQDLQHRRPLLLGRHHPRPGAAPALQGRRGRDRAERQSHGVCGRAGRVSRRRAVADRVPALSGGQSRLPDAVCGRTPARHPHEPDGGHLPGLARLP